MADFGWAIEKLKAGEKVRRRAFSPKTYITMTEGPDKVVMYHDSLRLVGRDTHFTRYRCVHDDFLGEDWEVARNHSDA